MLIEIPDIMSYNTTYIDTKIEHRPRHNTNQRKSIVKFLFCKEIVIFKFGIHDRQDNMTSSNDQRPYFIELKEDYQKSIF